MSYKQSSENLRHRKIESIVSSPTNYLPCHLEVCKIIVIFYWPDNNNHNHNQFINGIDNCTIMRSKQSANNKRTILLLLPLHFLSQGMFSLPLYLIYPLVPTSPFNPVAAFIYRITLFSTFKSHIPLLHNFLQVTYTLQAPCNKVHLNTHETLTHPPTPTLSRCSCPHALLNSCFHTPLQKSPLVSLTHYKPIVPCLLYTKCLNETNFRRLAAFFTPFQVAS